MKKSNVRLISFSDGTTMGDYLYIVSTNAPKEELRELERISCELYRNGYDEPDIPVWTDELEEKGYVFSILDYHQHISQYGSSREWKAEWYPEVDEHYQIENQIKKQEQRKENDEVKKQTKEIIKAVKGFNPDMTCTPTR